MLIERTHRARHEGWHVLAHAPHAAATGRLRGLGRWPTAGMGLRLRRLSLMRMGVGCFGCRAVGRFTPNSLVLVIIAFLLILLMVGQVLLGFVSFVRGAPMVLAHVGPSVRIRLRVADPSA